MKTNKHKRRPWHPALVTLMILVPILAFYALVEIFQGTPVHLKNRVREFPSKDTLVEARTLEIASRFTCSCGACGELSLDVCPCRRAIEERELIRAALQQGMNDTIIVRKIVERFGWMKSEFEHAYKQESVKK